jgi:exo-beta-1,3-glucanase (GH17 family)
MKRLGLCLLLLAGCSGKSGARLDPTLAMPSASAMPEPMPMPRGPCDDVLQDIGVPAETMLGACSTKEGARCLPEADLHRLGVAYSGYRTGEDPRRDVYPTTDEILEDLKILQERGFTLIRLFDSSTHAQRTLQVIHDNALDFKVQLGIWIKGGKATADLDNQADIMRGVALANQYSDIIFGVSVGNETLDSWSSVLTPAADLADYINQVRPLVPQPVTTDDMYPPYEMGTDYAEVSKVVDAIDYVSLHIYSFIDAQWSWDYQQLGMPPGPQRSQAMMAAGLAFTKKAVREARSRINMTHGFDLPIIIGEAGWKSKATKPGDSGEQYRAHPLNQQMFYRDFISWVAGPTRDADSPVAAEYFAAFDEPWKGQDDAWGLFDADRHPKFVISCSYPDLVPSGPTEYKPDDAVYYQ